MDRADEHLSLYGSPAEVGGLEWAWVDQQLSTAGAYWVVPAGGGHPHARPVWGIWTRDRLFLSIGSPRIAAAVRAGELVTVHLESATDVVIVEGHSAGTAVDADLLAEYDHKYEWSYSVDEYGPLTVIEPVKVMAWRSAGWAGRDGFEATGRWTLR